MREFDYTKHYARFHEFSESYYALLARSYQSFFRELLPKDKNAWILDIGCGTGFALNAIRQAGYVNAKGIDADPGQVKIAKDHYLPVEHVPVEHTTEFLQGFAGRLQTVILLDVLEHIPKSRTLHFLREICAALAPGGCLLCQVPNALWVLSSYSRYLDWTHECSFTTESLTFVLENSGFVVEDIRPGHQKPSPPSGPLSFAMPVLAKLLQSLTDAVWRVFVVAYLGVKRGFQHPVSADLFVIARRQGP